MLSIAATPKEYVMKFDSRSADAFGQIDLVVNKAGIWNVAPLRKDRAAAAGR